MTAIAVLTGTYYTCIMSTNPDNETHHSIQTMKTNINQRYEQQIPNQAASGESWLISQCCNQVDECAPAIDMWRVGGMKWNGVTGCALMLFFNWGSSELWLGIFMIGIKYGLRQSY